MDESTHLALLHLYDGRGFLSRMPMSLLFWMTRLLPWQRTQLQELLLGLSSCQPSAADPDVGQSVSYAPTDGGNVSNFTVSAEGHIKVKAGAIVNHESTNNELELPPPCPLPKPSLCSART